MPLLHQFHEIPPMYYFSDGVLWAFACCIAPDSQKHVVDTRMVDLCHKSTLLDLILPDKEVAYQLAEMHKSGSLRHLVQVHIILPSNPKYSRPTPIMTETQIGTTDQYIKTTILDISVYNMMDFHLFSCEFSEQVISMYKKRKIATRKSTRPKKKVKKF